MAQKTNSPHFPAFRLSRLSAALASCFISGSVLALPTGANVAHGTAVIAQNGQVLTVTNSNGAIINWQGFSIGAGETTRFIQPSAVSSVLNRVVTDNPSLILGHLQSNGQVFLINPAGIMVGAGARVDVAGFVASSLQLSDADFLAKRFHFTAVPGAGMVRNEGEIRTPTGGSVYMVAPQVGNAGFINSPAGEVILAAGQTVEIGDTATPGVRAAITGDGKTTNVGQIVANAGTIGLVGALVKNSGLLNASSAVSEGGRVYLRASDKLEQTASGAIDVNGTRGGSVLARADDTTLLDGSIKAVGHNGRGGEIQALGNKVGVIGAADLDASGLSGGGSILVGGDYQGRNIQVPNAEFTYVGAKTSLRADATRRGDGGKVIVWADDSTRAYGSISARGGEFGGDGGFIETSGKHYLDVSGIRVRADGALGGDAGLWLLDPDDLTVVAGTSDNNLTGNAPSFSNDTLNGGSRISTGTLNAAIAGNTNVSLFATNDVIFDGTYSGDIYVTKNSSDTFSTQLNVSAGAGSVLFKGNTTFQTIGASGTGGLTVNLAPGSGMSTILSGATLTVDGGVTSVALVPGYPMSHSLENYGTFNLKNNTYVDLGVGGYNSTFINRSTGVVNVRTNGASTVALFPFQSDTIQGGVVYNEGVWNADLTSASQSYEVLFSNLAGAALNVTNGGTSRHLSLQNADQLSGSVSIGSGSTVWLSEMHANSSSGGAYVYFSGANVNGPGLLKVGGGAYDVLAKFDGASLNGAAKLWLASGSGGTGGDVEFFGAQSTLNGSSIFWGRPSAWTVPSTSQLALSGGVGFYSASDLYVGNLATPGALYLAAGWDGVSFLPTPTVGNAGSVSIFGSVSSSGAMWVRANDDIRIDAADSSAVLLGGGGSQRLIAGGDVKVRGGVGSALVRYTGSGTQTITADKVIVEGDTAGGDGHWAKIRSEGSQNVQAATSVIVQGGGNSSGGHGNYAAIEATGSQFVRTPSLRVQGGDGGSVGYNNYASISQLKLTGSQKIVIDGGGLGLEVSGGAGTGTTAWTGAECPGCPVSNNSASIHNKGSGTQEIDFLGGGSLVVSGGSGIDASPQGSLNDASISNEGSGIQKIWSSTGNHPDITVTGGGSGGYYNTTYKRNLGNDAGIDSDGMQIVKANSLTLDGSGGSASVGGAFLTAPVQNVTVANDLIMVGGGSTVAGQYGMGTPTVIGYDNGADISITVGGDFSAAGTVSATGGMVMVGAAEGLATIDISANSLVFGARSYLGNLDQSAGGSITLQATAGGISQNASFARLSTDTLTALATHNIDFSYGDSRVSYADLYTTMGDVSLRTNNATTHLVRMRTDSGSVSAINGTGNLALGDIRASGSASLTARQSILDDNGSATVNVAAPTIYLTSEFGGLSGGLAISADVQSPGGAVSAYVGYEGAPASGGVRIESLGFAAPASLSITDTALAGGDIFYKHHGNVSSNANFAVSSQSGSLIFAATGSLGLAAGVFAAPDGMAFTAGGNLDVTGNLNLASTSSLIATGNVLVSGGLAVSAPTTVVSGGEMAVTGNVSASRLSVTAGGAMSMNGGSVTASGPLTLDVGNLSLANGSIAAGGVLNVSADAVSVDLASMQAGSGVFLSVANLQVNDGGKVISQNSGVRVEAAQDIKVLAGGEIKAPSGSVTLLANRDVVVDGALTAGTTVSLDALNMLSVGGSVLASGVASLVADSGISVAGSVSASQLSVTAGGAMSVNGGSVTASGPLTLDVGNLSLANGSIAAGGALNVSADAVSVDLASMQAGSGVFLSVANLQVNDGGKVISQNVGVRVEAAQDIKVLAGGEIKAPSGSVTLLANRDVVVAGALTAGTTVSLDALNMLSVGGSVLASGAASLVADGGISVAGQVDCSDLELTTGADLLMTGGRLRAANHILLKAFSAQLLDGSTLQTDYGNISGEFGQNLKLSNGSKILAGDDVKLRFSAANSKLILNEVAGLAPSVIEADRYTMVPATIYLDFPEASGGSVVVDGLETTFNQSGGSGFYAAGSPALAGAGLQLTYGVPVALPPPITDILNTKPPATDSTSLQGVTPLLVQATEATGGQLVGSENTGTNDEFGGGSATGDNNEGKNRNRRRGGMCRG